MMRFRIFKGLGIAALAVAALGGFGYLVMSLWNWVVPEVTGLHPVTWLQAIALLALSRLLFGGLHRHGGGWHWRHRMQARWQHMTPEERERFRDRFGSRRCGFHDEPTPPGAGAAG